MSFCRSSAKLLPRLGARSPWCALLAPPATTPSAPASLKAVISQRIWSLLTEAGRQSEMCYVARQWRRRSRGRRREGKVIGGNGGWMATGGFRAHFGSVSGSVSLCLSFSLSLPAQEFKEDACAAANTPPTTPRLSCAPLAHITSATACSPHISPSSGVLPRALVPYAGGVARSRSASNSLTALALNKASSSSLLFSSPHISPPPRNMSCALH